ncbi:hypothetical protein TNIN_416011 [Trichonephila inaurata madagascariensis]|uniref:Uncharacterized protein n=1 Tax=Trichonephila inaurata madagascariensis TaxID=2747483 RepID=A0A8X7CK84_9ARAC|nr:hypothetical protein TNIN_416011 [Trichonephila inaurata madagascariensis]
MFLEVGTKKKYGGKPSASTRHKAAGMLEEKETPFHGPLAKRLQSIFQGGARFAYSGKVLMQAPGETDSCRRTRKGDLRGVDPPEKPEFDES